MEADRSANARGQIKGDGRVVEVEMKILKVAKSFPHFRQFQTVLNAHFRIANKAAINGFVVINAHGHVYRKLTVGIQRNHLASSQV